MKGRYEKVIKYNKLVRDKIPDKITCNGGKAAYHILSEEKYIVELDKKLNEEVKEYQADKSLEEMADILEVLHAICKARGYTIEELEAKRKGKVEVNGSFDEKIYLEYVENEDTTNSASVSDMKALKKWGQVPDYAKDLILSNVYCSKCGNTTVVDYSMHSDRLGIVINGKCVSCGSKVVRVVED
jgi:predicted house-cleaning noncanonical NTP pyrophosphatase (MazG superfamily)